MIYLAIIALGLAGGYAGHRIADEWYKLKDSGWD
jgi:hypothetical protein